jgi:hypothetical protein
MDSRWIVLRNAIRSAAAIALVSVSVCHAGENIAGRWEGSAQLPESEITFVVDLAQDTSGTWVGSIIVPGFGVKGTPLGDITVKDSEATFAIKNERGLQASFKGHLNADRVLAGDFVQAGNTARFVLKKIGPPQVELPLHSTAVTKELEGEWKGEYELFGYSRHVTLKLSNPQPDTATAELVIVGKKTNNLPIDLVRQEGGLVIIDSHAMSMSYEGRLTKGEIDGTLNQGGLELPLVLRRAR